MSYEYEGDLLTKVTYPNDGTVSYEYDKEGNIHSVTDQLKRRYVTNEYDRKGRVVRQTMADGSEYIMFYNDRERKNTFTNVSTGEKTIYEYGRQKVVTKITYADGTTEHFDYDERENKIYQKDRNGNETHRTYDIFGNVTEEKQPSGLITTTEYDVHQNKVHQFDNAGRDLYWEYDKNGNITAEKMLLENGKWCQMFFTYDSEGRLQTLTNPRGNQIKYTYDTRFSEPTSKTEPEGETTRYTYDKAGRCLKEDSIRGSKYYCYNSTDCLTEIKDEDKHRTKFRYDLLSNQTRIINGYEDSNLEKGLQIDYDLLGVINGCYEL